MSEYANLLRKNPDFTYLWIAQVISLLGDWFNTIALTALVAVYSDGSGLAVSLFFLARVLPPLMVSPYAGVLVDRFDRKLILIYSNLSRVAVVLMFLFATSKDMLWLIYVLTVLQFLLSAVFEPGQAAILPNIIQEKYLVTANTLRSVTWSAMLALGAIIGGVVSSIFGWEIAILVDAMTFAVSAGFILLVNVPQQMETDYSVGEPSKQEDKGNGSFLEGLRYLRANPLTAVILMIKGGGSIGNMDTLMTIYATQVFILGNDGQLSLGIMYSAFGIGAIMGPLVLNRFHDNSVWMLRRMVIIGFILITLGWTVLGIASTLLVLSAGVMLRAMGASSNWTYSSVIIQKQVSDRFMGRVFSLDFAMFQLASVFSTIIHGAVVIYGSDGLQMIVFATAAVSMLPLAAWWFAVPRMENREIAVVLTE